MTKERKYDLQDRLVDYAGELLELPWKLDIPLGYWVLNVPCWLLDIVKKIKRLVHHNSHRIR